MSKPEDITQDVWDVAVKAVYAGRGRVSTKDEPTFERVARAIMAAKAEAYSEAADLAQRMGAGRQAQIEQAKAAKALFVARDFESMAMSAFDVAAAIRRRGED